MSLVFLLSGVATGCSLSIAGAEVPGHASTLRAQHKTKTGAPLSSVNLASRFKVSGWLTSVSGLAPLFPVSPFSDFAPRPHRHMQGAGGASGSVTSRRNDFVLTTPRSSCASHRNRRFTIGSRRSGIAVTVWYQQLVKIAFGPSLFFLSPVQATATFCGLGFGLFDRCIDIAFVKNHQSWRIYLNFRFWPPWKVGRKNFSSEHRRHGRQSLRPVERGQESR